MSRPAARRSLRGRTRRIVLPALALLALLALPSAAAAVDASRVTSTGSFDETGDAAGEVKLLCVTATNARATFSTVNAATTTSDTKLYLFSADDRPLWTNDDATTKEERARLSVKGLSIGASYRLYVTHFTWVPVDGSGDPLFPAANPRNGGLTGTWGPVPERSGGTVAAWVDGTAAGSDFQVTMNGALIDLAPCASASGPSFPGIPASGPLAGRTSAAERPAGAGRSGDRAPVRDRIGARAVVGRAR
ncbi:MAG: hypothetical protein RL338_798 [Chloroflexota bacterium]